MSAKLSKFFKNVFKTVCLDVNIAKTQILLVKKDIKLCKLY